MLPFKVLGIIIDFAPTAADVAPWRHVSQYSRARARLAPVVTHVVWPPFNARDDAPDPESLRRILQVPAVLADAPLHLELRAVSLQYLREVLSIVQLSISRLVSFYFDGQGVFMAAAVLVEHLTSPAPNLEKLSIHSPLTYDQVPHYVLDFEDLFSSSAPRLRELSLQLDGVPSYRVRAFDNVKTLSLACVRFEWMEDQTSHYFLAGCSSVENVLVHHLSVTQVEEGLEDACFLRQIQALKTLEVFPGSEPEDAVELLDKLANPAMQSICAHGADDPDTDEPFPHGFVSALVETLPGMQQKPLVLKLLPGSQHPGSHEFVLSPHGDTPDPPSRTFIIHWRSKRPMESAYNILKHICAAGVSLSHLRRFELTMSRLSFLPALCEPHSRFPDLEELYLWLDSWPLPSSSGRKWPGQTLRKVVFFIRSEQLEYFLQHDGGRQLAMRHFVAYVDPPRERMCQFTYQVRQL